MRRLHFIFHLIVYYSAWLIGIVLAAHNDALLATAFILTTVMIQIIWQIYIMHDTKNLYILVILLTSVGFIIDTLYLQSGFVIFKANPFSPYFSPPWMITIWISFAVTIFATLKRLFDRYVLIGCLSLPGFALAYYFGVYMGAACYPHGYTTSIAIGITWLFLLPLCLRLYNLVVRIPCLK